MFRYRKRNAAFTWISVIWIVIMIGVFIAVILNHWKSSAYKQGYADAYERVSESYDEGYNRGYSLGYEDGYKEGYRERASQNIDSGNDSGSFSGSFQEFLAASNFRSNNVPTVEAEQPLDTQTPAAQMVYITDSGKKYHSASCSYLSKSKIPISLDDAIARRYTACSKCW